MRLYRFAFVLVAVAHGCATDDTDDIAVVDDDSLNEDVSEPPIATDDSADPTEVDDVFTEPDDLTSLTIDLAKTYRNPIAKDCADPGVIGTAGPEFYTVCTGFARKSSSDLVHWKADGSLFTAKSRPAWGDGKWWAPEIHRIGDRYVAYFVANRTSTNRMCIGAATATSPQGPFEDLGHPLVCDGTYGLIDPDVFTAADGKHYLYYKIDGNAFKPPRKTIIYGRQLSANGVGVVGVRHRMIENTLGWEGLVTEAPWVIARGKYFYMFYSGAAYNTSRYGIGVARATSPLGPFHKRSTPILSSNATWKGPGHNSTIVTGGHRYIVYAAWHDTAGEGKRDMLLDRINWSGGWPSVNNGTPSIGTHTAPTVP
ncbi:MAG TPA: glycoside hydrolase family 43 protein [Kofleriaceae bacterium]|nr:glycoside hydrolase family 43 protein [Kofleriaceae bacterium]